MSARQIKRWAKKEAENLISPKNKKYKSEKCIQNQIEENIQEYEESIQNINNFDSVTFSDSSEKSEENEFNLCEELAKWAIQFQVSFVAINALLLLLLKCNIHILK